MVSSLVTCGSAEHMLVSCLLLVHEETPASAQACDHPRAGLFFLTNKTRRENRQLLEELMFLPLVLSSV